MNPRKKLIRAAAFVLLLGGVLAAGFFAFHRPVPEGGFRYVQINCSIYDRDANLLFLRPAQLCVFHEDGSLLVSAPTKKMLRFLDREDKPVWEVSDTEVHHDLKIKGDVILGLTSEYFKFGKNQVRGDCVFRRNLSDGRLQAQWCLKDHIQELQELGFSFEEKPERFLRGAEIGTEISHANSIYEIPENASSGKDPAFRAGNYLFNLFGSSRALLILDHDMKKILWSKNMQQFNNEGEEFLIDSHDLQVTPEGNILAFFNRVVPRKRGNCRNRGRDKLPCSSPESLLVEFDPFSEKLKWVYGRPGFTSDAYGSVRRLDNGNYLYSHTFGANGGVSGPGEVFEVMKGGDTVWKLDAAKLEEKNQIRGATALSPGFLLSRNLVPR